MYAQVVRAQACANDVQHRGRFSCANMSCYVHMVRRDSSAIKFDRVETTFILAFFSLAVPLNRWRRGGNQSTRRKPLASSFRKCHTLHNLKSQAPSETGTGAVALVSIRCEKKKKIFIFFFRLCLAASYNKISLCSLLDWDICYTTWKTDIVGSVHGPQSDSVACAGGSYTSDSVACAGGSYTSDSVTCAGGSHRWATLESLLVVHSDIGVSTGGPQWHWSLYWWSTVTLESLLVVHSDIGVSTGGPQWHCWLNWWSTVTLESLLVVHSDIGVSTGGPQWHWSLYWWSTVTLLALLVVHSDTVGSTGGPQWHLALLVVHSDTVGSTGDPKRWGTSVGLLMVQRDEGHQWVYWWSKEMDVISGSTDGPKRWGSSVGLLMVQRDGCHQWVYWWSKEMRDISGSTDGPKRWMSSVGLLMVQRDEGHQWVYWWSKEMDVISGSTDGPKRWGTSVDLLADRTDKQPRKLCRWTTQMGSLCVRWSLVSTFQVWGGSGQSVSFGSCLVLPIGGVVSGEGGVGGGGGGVLGLLSHSVYLMLSVSGNMKTLWHFQKLLAALIRSHLCVLISVEK